MLLVTTELSSREIVKGKKDFAYKIVPELDSSEFEKFRMIFEKIERILRYLQDENKRD